MDAIRTNNVIIHIVHKGIVCPRCKKIYPDTENKYSDRIKKNKYKRIKIKCDCGQTFCVAYDNKGELVSFYFNWLKNNI